jgi:hypothetical protein
MSDQDQDQAAELDRGGDQDQAQADQAAAEGGGDRDQAAELDQGELFDRKPVQYGGDPGDRPRRRSGRRII